MGKIEKKERVFVFRICEFSPNFLISYFLRLLGRLGGKGAATMGFTGVWL